MRLLFVLFVEFQTQKFSKMSFFSFVASIELKRCSREVKIAIAIVNESNDVVVTKDVVVTRDVVVTEEMTTEI